MCGPLALALPSGAGSASGFLGGRLAYNGGRIVTYCVLGLIFGLVGRTLLLAGVQRWASIALGLALLAGLFFFRKMGFLGPVTGLVEALKRRMSSLLRRRPFGTLTVLGLVKG